MAGLTSTGLVIKTQPEILESIYDKYRSRIDPNWDTNPNNLINIQAGIMADELSDAWEGIQGVYDACFPKSASNLNLDNICDMVKVRRLSAMKSHALVEFNGAVGTTIQQGTALKVTGTENKFFTTAAHTLTATQFKEVTINVTSVANLTSYQLTINGNPINITSDASANNIEIIGALMSAVNSAGVGVTATMPDTSTLKLVVDTVDVVYPLVIGARLAAATVSDLITVEAEVAGEVTALVGTLNSLLIPVVGITSVNNAQNAVVGRLEESDNELRLRRYESVASTGGGSFNALYSAIAGLSGVRYATIAANSTASPSYDGVPSKAFMVIVDGGESAEIAQAILTKAPIGIESYGSVSEIVVDAEGNPQTIKFSRPTPVYIHVKVQYSDYEEELVPLTNSTTIKNSVLAYGNSLTVGKDIIPTRFMGSVYSNTSGVGNVVVTIAKSVDGLNPTPFSSSVILIGRNEIPIFRDDLILVERV